MSNKTVLNRAKLSEDLVSMLEIYQHDNNSMIEEYQKELVKLGDEVLTGHPDVGKLDVLHLLYNLRSLLDYMKA